MLSEIMVRAIEALEEYDKAKTMVSAQQKNVHTLELLEKTLNEYERTIDLWSECRAHGWLLGTSPEDQWSRLNDTVNSIINSLGANMTIEDAEVTRLYDYVVQLKMDLRLEWVGTVGQECSNIASALSTCRPLLDEFDNLSILYSVLRNTVQAMPEDKKAVNKVLHSLTEGRKMLDSLGTNTEIQTFINKVGSNLASLADVSPHIREWLESHQLLTKIKIRF